MIRTILASVAHNPHYLTKYINFISRCQEKSNIGHTEKHHICPRAMFPEFTSFSEFPWNCAALTPRQHFIAHLMLHKVYSDVLSQSQALFLMSNTRGLKINSKLYAKLRLELSDTVTVKDSCDKTFSVSKTDSRYLSGELVGVSKGRVVVKDIQGNAYSVSTIDPRYLSGELIHVLKGIVPVKDAQGKIFGVSTADSRYLSGELVHHSKGTTTVKNSEGKTFQVEVNDSRYLSGELIPVAKGTISKTRGLTTEQIREIRVAAKNPSSAIPIDFIASQVKAADIHKIGKVPITELKYVNGRSLSYKRLLINFYADKYSVYKHTVVCIIEGKTYKEVVV